MKRTTIILFALFLLLSSGQLLAQEQERKPYKPAAAFRGDTLLYLEYNYAMRSAEYIGKTVGEILQDLEYPVLYILEAAKRRDPIENINKLIGLCLGIRQAHEKPSPISDYYIEIRFDNPPIMAEYEKACGYDSDNPDRKFTQRMYDFLKDLKVSRVNSNPYMAKDPELKKVRKEEEIQEREKIFKEFKQAGMPEEEIQKLRKNFEKREKQ